MLKKNDQTYVNYVKNVAQVAVFPVQSGAFAVKQGIGDAFSFLTFWKSGEERIKNLEQRNLELLSYQQEAVALRQENGILQKQFSSSTVDSHRLLPVQVLYAGDHLLLAAGSADGVNPGESVMLYNNFLGIISRVDPQTAIVQLPSDPLSKTPVKVNGAQGIVTGQFNSSMLLDKIAQNESLATGDVVLTSGDMGLQPGLIVGKVGKIESVKTDLFQKAEIISQVDLKSLNLVFVVKN